MAAQVPDLGHPHRRVRDAHGPIDALMLAASEPGEYARIVDEAHPDIAAFGGTFPLMVALDFFFDDDKRVHWAWPVER